MGLRFQRRFSLIPGLRLNLSKHGASLSVGQAWRLVHCRPATLLIAG
jgi:Protein of unknown function (DUF4236)